MSVSLLSGFPCITEILCFYVDNSYDCLWNFQTSLLLSYLLLYLSPYPFPNEYFLFPWPDHLYAVVPSLLYLKVPPWQCFLFVFLIFDMVLMLKSTFLLNIYIFLMMKTLKYFLVIFKIPSSSLPLTEMPVFRNSQEFLISIYSLLFHFWLIQKIRSLPCSSCTQNLANFTNFNII